MTDNLPVPDDAPWLKHAGLSPEEIQELRKQKYEITEYAKEKLRKLMNDNPTHEYNENLAITNEDTHKALVSHFNQIEDIAKNKKFEWEDEELTETYNITYDFDEWFSQLEDLINKDWYERYHYIVPENLHNDLMDYANQLKDYVNGFLLGPCGMYQGKSFDIKRYYLGTFDEIVEHMKQVRQNNQMVFLCEVYQQTKRPEEVVLDDGTYLYEYYFIQYGILND